jgi:NitT/TauT family transport system substrate-binding protein
MKAITRRKALQAGLAATLGWGTTSRKAFSQAARPVSFTLAWLPTGNSLFINVAKRRDIFKKHGLDITISRGFGSAPSAQTIGAGKFDFGMSNPHFAILQTAKGLPVTNLGLLDYDSTMGILVEAESNVRSLKDLEGKKLGITVSSGEVPFLPLFAQKSGADYSRIEKVQYDPQVRNRALITKEVAAISAFSTASVPSLLVQGIQTRFFPFKNADLNIYGLSFNARPEMVKKDPGLCRAVMDASYEGLYFALTNLEEALEDFHAEFPEFRATPKLKDQHRIEFGMSAATVFSRDARQHGLGWMDPKVIDQHIDLTMRYLAEKTDRRPAPEEVFTNDYAGSIKIGDAEWQKLVATYDKYSTYLG